MRNRWLGYTAVSMALACGGSSSKSTATGSVIHCDYPAQAMCFTVRAPAFTPAQLTALQNECTTDTGTYGTGACSTTNAVAGTCTVTNPANMPTTQVSGLTVAASFYTPTHNATTAAASCGAMGTWAAGGGGGGGTTVVSCTWAGDGCQMLSGTITGTELTAIQGACAGSAGTSALAACSSAGAVAGSCYYADGNILAPVAVAGAITGRAYYFAAGWTLAAAQSDCAAPPAGVWQ